MISSALLALRGIQKKDPLDLVQGLVVALIGAMQGIEAVAWDHQDCGPLNQGLSHSILWLLTAQVVLVPLLILQLYPRNDLKNYVGLMITGILATAFAIRSKLLTVPACTTQQSQGCRLVWGTFRNLPNQEGGKLLTVLFGIFYQALFTLALLSLPNPFQYPIRAGILPISAVALFVILMTRHRNFFDETSFGSIWCFLAVALGPIALFKI